jgi:hypothetical protein
MVLSAARRGKSRLLSRIQVGCHTVAIRSRTGLLSRSLCGRGAVCIKGVAIVYGVIRWYAGSGAKELFDLIVERKDEVEGLLRGVTGFASYTLIQTDDGGVTVTVCQDKAGTDESVQVARDWVAANAADLGTAAPTVTEGSVGMHLS